MDEAEEKLFNSIVDGLRNKGWTRIDAEGEAFQRIIEHRAAQMARRSPRKRAALPMPSSAKK